jgi:hypothetical protein
LHARIVGSAREAALTDSLSLALQDEHQLVALGPEHPVEPPVDLVAPEPQRDAVRHARIEARPRLDPNGVGELSRAGSRLVRASPPR